MKDFDEYVDELDEFVYTNDIDVDEFNTFTNFEIEDYEQDND